MSPVEQMVEITLPNEENFLKIKETLTRIGVSSKAGNTLYQSCHILHKRGKYYIVHFKELFILDGKNNTFTDDDKGRRNTITNLLEEWGLLAVVNPDMVCDPISPLSHIRIIPFRDKDQWELVPKYNIGKRG